MCNSVLLKSQYRKISRDLVGHFKCYLIGENVFEIIDNGDIIDKISGKLGVIKMPGHSKTLSTFVGTLSKIKDRHWMR